MTLSLVDKINSRGHANGWCAKMMRDRCARTGEAMSAAFRRSITNAVAFSVPARAVKATGTRVHYEFLDGSTDRFPLPNFARKK